MPVLTTEVISNVTETGGRPFAQYAIILVNNSGFSANVYLEGISISNGSQTFFAQETVTLPASGAAVRNYPAFFDFAQFIAYASMNQVTVQAFAIDSNHAYTKLPVVPMNFKRITSEFRNNILVTASEQAVLSYRRTSNFALPTQFGAALFAQGVEIISSLPIRYKLVQGGTVNGTFQSFPTPTTNIPTDSTALQVNFTCTTVTGGRVVYEGQTFGASEAFFNAVILFDDNKLADLPEEQPLTLVVSAIDGPDQIFVTFRMFEEW